MSAFEKPAFAPHVHVIAPPFRFHTGEQLGTAHCATCGRGLQYVLEDRSVMISRAEPVPQWTAWRTPRTSEVARS